MTIWKLVRLDAGEHRRGDELGTAFRAAFAGAGRPVGAAMYADHDESRAYRFYFSPDAARLFARGLDAAGATVTKAPNKRDVSFIAGSDECELAWETEHGLRPAAQ